MNRWVSPVDGRYSNGWWPRLLWPHVIFGNSNAGIPGQVLDVRDFSVRSIDEIADPLKTALVALRARPANTNAQGDIVSQDAAGLLLTFADGRTARVAVSAGAWEGPGIIAYRLGEPWLWTPVAGGQNEQAFAFGRRVFPTSTSRGLWIEMPSAELQAEHDPRTDTWTLAGFAQGNHGTPDYPDGLMHVVTGVPADSPLTLLADHLMPFDFPIRLPDEIAADVWTFGDTPSGTIGGGLRDDRPNRQGIGLWSKADAAKYGAVEDAPWLDLARPVLGVWTSPYDARQGLRMFRDEDHFRKLLTAYRVSEPVAAEVLDIYRHERAGGGYSMDTIEEWIAVDVCRRTGCSLTIYDDHALEEVPGSEGTRYRPELLGRAYGLQSQGIGVVFAMRNYPDGQAGWALEDCAREIIAGNVTWLGHAAQYPEAKPMPVAFTLALYTKPWAPDAWFPSAVARRLEEQVRVASHLGVLCLDVFGVGRDRELPEWNAWAARWLSAVLQRTRGVDVARWPVTPKPVPPPAPPPSIPPTVPSTSTPTNPVVLGRPRPGSTPVTKTQSSKGQVAVVVGGGIVSALLAWWKGRKKS